MRTSIDCMPCFIRQALESSRMATDDAKVQHQIIGKVLSLASEMDLNQTPPAIAKEIHKIIRDLTGNDDPYAEVKARFNGFSMSLYNELKTLAAQADDPFETAVRLAIAGNIIDFGVNAQLDDEHVHHAIDESLKYPIDNAVLESLRKGCKNAKDILYLGDNAGEIVFDRILIEQINHKKITFVVKGGPIINDSTIKDAKMTGMTDIAEVIDNGDNAPGTILENCSAEFQKRFAEAELVISKGQGNYETLNDVQKNIFFILRAKCPVVAGHLNCRIGDLVLVENKNDSIIQKS